VFDDKAANVLLGGAGIAVPIGERAVGALTLTAFRDNYEGRHHQYEACGTLSYALSDRARVHAGGAFYPRGIPLAGTSFSTASMVGAFYGGSLASSFRTRSLGFLSLAVDYTF
jgi:hypothetical protein